jgi:hypothetical protein
LVAIGERHNDSSDRQINTALIGHCPTDPTPIVDIKGDSRA